MTDTIEPSVEELLSAGSSGGKMTMKQARIL